MSATLTPIERAKITEALNSGLKINQTTVDGNYVAYAGKEDRVTNRLFATGAKDSFGELWSQAEELWTKH